MVEEARRRFRTPGAGCCGGLRGVVAAAILVGCIVDSFLKGMVLGKYFFSVAALPAAGTLRSLENLGEAIFKFGLRRDNL